MRGQPVCDEWRVEGVNGAGKGVNGWRREGEKRAAWVVWPMPDGGIAGRVRAKLPKHAMPLKTIPFGPPSAVHYGSDVAGVIFSGKYLLVQVACDIDATGLVHGLAVVFSDASAFRYLDEMDLARYWGSDGFVHGFHVLKGFVAQPRPVSRWSCGEVG